MPLGDCEQILDGLVVQPVNALSSLAFVMAGFLVPALVRRRLGVVSRSAQAFGLALVLVGVGSMAFHGPAGPLSGWLHDASITALLVLVLGVELGHRSRWSEQRILAVWGGSAVALGLVVAFWPQAGDPLNAPLAALAVVGLVASPFRSSPAAFGAKRVRAPLAVLAVGAIVMVLSRTGGPLCDPGGLIQGHAVWHILAAAGIGMYAVSVAPLSED